MTEKENNLEQAKLNLKEAESKLKEAGTALEIGKRKAIALYDEAVDKLAHEMTRAQIAVDRERAYVKKAEADLEKPYSNNSVD